MKQWASLDPHQPYKEQQFPNRDPAQVWPRRLPHCPSVDTGALPVGVLEGGDEADDAQDEGTAVMVVVVVDKPVIVRVTVCVCPVGPTTVTVTKLVVLEVSVR